MRGRVPVERRPCRCSEIGAGGLYQRRDVLGVEGMTVRSAVAIPQMIEVDLGERLCVLGDLYGRDLPVDGAVFRSRNGLAKSGRELRGKAGAILPPDKEFRCELCQQRLLELVAESVAVRVH